MIATVKSASEIVDLLEKENVDTDFIQSDSGLFDASFNLIFDEKTKELQIKVIGKAPFMNENLQSSSVAFPSIFKFAKTIKILFESNLKTNNEDFISKFVLNLKNQFYNSNLAYKDMFKHEKTDEIIEENICYQKYDKKQKQKHDLNLIEKALNNVNKMLQLKKSDYQIIFDSFEKETGER